MRKQISFQNIPQISAIYFAMLQCGYEYYAHKKDADFVKIIESFRTQHINYDVSFFLQIKQKTCEVYPYWPRAALLESATFFLEKEATQFRNFEIFRNNIMSAGNISDIERNQDLWEWIESFPAALARIMQCSDFKVYLEWESKWIQKQNIIWKNDLEHIQCILDNCLRYYNSPIQSMSIVLNPIKCAYSADYHINKNQLFFCSGDFNVESVVHEFLHHVIHPFIEKSRVDILKSSTVYPGIDKSYYLSGDEDGKINAFEEYMVRHISKKILAKNFPLNLDLHIKDVLRGFS